MTQSKMSSMSIITPLKVQFKWSPCSIKSDFMKLSSICNVGWAQQPKSHNNSTTQKQFFGQSSRIAGANSSIYSSMGQNASVNFLQKQNQVGSNFIRPKHLINHFEGHKELSRKDELVSNLRTQLQHHNENLFDYTPITF